MSVSRKVLLVLFVLSVHNALGRSAPIVITPAVHDHNVTGCTTHNYNQTECESLELALKVVAHLDEEDSSLMVIYIPIGQHNLESRHVFTNKMGLQLKGKKNSSHHLTGSVVHKEAPYALVKCLGSKAGLAFNSSTNITITGLTFEGCGALQPSTSKDWNNDTRVLSLEVALYFLNCENVNIIAVHVLNSPGTGLAMLNTGGRNVIKDSEFVSSFAGFDVKSKYGGSGVRIEFILNSTLGDPGVLLKTKTKALYEISNNIFANNTAAGGKYLMSHITKQDENNPFTFGMGGGLSIFFGPNSTHNKINIDGCRFVNNSANQGGGLSILFLYSSRLNTVTVTASSFVSNNCTTQDIPPSHRSYGGGIAISTYKLSSNNSAIISATNFTGNTAFFGGGLSVHTGSHNYSTTFIKTFFKASECEFANNIARIGAAMDLYCRKPVEIESKCSLFPIISDINFTNNCGTYTYNNSAVGRTFATLSIQYLPTVFEGTVSFLRNSASGLGMQECAVEVKENSSIRFSGNIGKIGGGMVLIGRSCIILNSQCAVNFDGNIATEKGGAIYAVQTQERYIAYDYSCFFKHTKSFIHPNDWATENISISFSNNTVAQHVPNAIYVSSLLPCVWPTSFNSELHSDIMSTFCKWKSWHFHDKVSCTHLIATLPANFSRTLGYELSVYPGQAAHLQRRMAVYDDLGHNVINTTSLTGFIKNQQQIDSQIELQIRNKHTLVIQGNPNHNKTVDVVLQTVDERSITTKIKVTISSCPPGTQMSKKECECMPPTSFRSNLRCTQHHSIITAALFVGHCISYMNRSDDSNSELVVARCPYLAGDLRSCTRNKAPYQPLPSTTNETETEFDQQFCKDVSREGPLCRQCTPGNGIDLFEPNYRCINCTRKPQWRQWTKVLLLITVPITVFFLIVTIFHIGVTSDSTNGYIFFSQMITFPLEVLIVQSAWTVVFEGNHKTTSRLTSALFVPYRIWSLEFPQIFLSKICLSESFKVVHVLALQYINAFYALFLVFVAYILIELHARNYRPLVYLWRPLCFVCVRLRRNWDMRTSVIDAFATFILLCYSKLVGTSIALLAPNEVYTANGTQVQLTLHYDTSVVFLSKQHLPFAAIAIVILSTLGAIPPFLLLLYPFQWFQKMLNCCHLNRHGLRVFMDAFQGIYRNGADGGPERRYFAGLYFAFRIIINLMYSMPMSLSDLYAVLTVTYIVLMVILVILRPYKNNFYNNLDAIFIAILGIKSCLTYYSIMYAIQFGEIPQAAWSTVYAICHLPTMYFIGFCVYWICSRSRFIQTHCIPRCLRMHNRIRYFRYNRDSTNSWSSISFTSPSETNLLDTSEMLSDRVVNPHRYEHLNNYAINRSEVTATAAAAKRSGQTHNEKSRRPFYGSTTY